MDTVDGPQGAAVPPPDGTVVVAGGSGFIGRHLIPALTLAGHPVVVLSRRPQAVPAFPSGTGSAGAAGVSDRPDPPTVRVAGWDPDNLGTWCDTLSGAAALINLCGASIGGGRWTRARKHTLVASRTGPSQTLVAACNGLDHPPAALLQASGVGYYGTGAAEVDEGAESGSDFLAGLAREWEAPLADTDLRTVSLRFGVAFGPDGGALGQMLLPFRLFIGGPMASGQQWLSWIHVLDLVRAVLFVLDSPLAGAVNVTSPQPVRNAEFARIAGAVLGRPAWLSVPRFVLEVLLGEQATLVCDGQRAVPARLEAAGFNFLYPELAAALEDAAR